MQHSDKKNLKNFGLRVKKIRQEKFNSLNKCAFEQGRLTSATISRIENGLVDFKFSTLLNLACMLKTTPSELLKDFDYELGEE